MTTGSARFRRAERLRDARDFRRLAAGARRANSRNFVVLVLQRSDLEGPKLGITASRRVGDAVERNRVKRVIREWFRRAKGDLPPGLDLVVIARSGAVALSQHEAALELASLWKKAAS